MPSRLTAVTANSAAPADARRSAVPRKDAWLARAGGCER
jgi:hypothetical protein